MKHTILIVDDDTLIINTLKQRFSTWDIDIYTAANSEDAKKILEEKQPELVLLDLLLTQSEGSQGILDFLKSKDSLVNVPVLVLTNLDKPDLKKQVMSQGVKEYIIKGSISLDELFQKVLSYLEPQGKNN